MFELVRDLTKIYRGAFPLLFHNKIMHNTLLLLILNGEGCKCSIF